MKRTQVMFSVYAPIEHSDAVRTKVIEALEHLNEALGGLEWDIDIDNEIVECPTCGSSHDCECQDETVCAQCGADLSDNKVIDGSKSLGCHDCDAALCSYECLTVHAGRSAGHEPIEPE